MERAWKCDVCGKWSHAKRRPKHHVRSQSAESWAPSLPPDAVVLETFTLGHSGDEQDFVRFRCGPFVEYRVERVESGGEG